MDNALGHSVQISEALDIATTLWFDDPASEAALVGGKGVNLARLAGAGFRVPNGFTVTTDAYSAMLTESGVSDQLGRILAGIDYHDAEQLDRSAGRIRELLAGSSMPEAVRSEILAGYEKLGGFVAVRSSGTAEDLADASFAGLHDTFLDVLGGDEVCAAVRRCWASMWTARAVAYRNKNGFDHFAVRIAVVVQEMVAAEVAGVMFTGNPITAATDELVVNASLGLGESVVSGLVTPDEFVVRARDLTVKHKVLGEKAEEIIRVDTGGTVHREVDADRRARFTLTDELERISRSPIMSSG